VYISFRYRVLEIAASILIKKEILSASRQLSNQVVIHLLPFMVITNDDMESAEMEIAIYLSKSGICSLHPLLKGWKEGKKVSGFFLKKKKKASNTLNRR
jgi:U3 small nucleolar RNA-associated protein 10